MKAIVSFFPHEEVLKVWIERTLIGLFSSLLCFAIYTLMDDQFWLGYVEEINASLAPIATVNEKKGAVERRTRIDTLWIPVQMKKVIYDGDVVSTGSESTVEIGIGQTTKIFVESDSLIRLKQFNGKPLIRLSEGSVKAEFSEDQVLLIKKGSVIEEVLMRKGTYLIKNDQSAGIQITTFDQEAKTTAGHEEDKSSTKAKSEGQDEPATNAKAKSQPHIKDAPKAAFDLPTPDESVTFLVRSPKAILISAQERCENSCSIRIYREHELVKSAEFKPGEPSFLKLEPENVLDGNYEWTFETETSNFKSFFEVKRFSDDELAKALNSGKPIEVLE